MQTEAEDAPLTLGNRGGREVGPGCHGARSSRSACISWASGQKKLAVRDELQHVVRAADGVEDLLLRVVPAGCCVMQGAAAPGGLSNRCVASNRAACRCVSARPCSYVETSCHLYSI